MNKIARNYMNLNNIIDKAAEKAVGNLERNNMEFKEKCIEFQRTIEQKFKDFEADTGMKIGYISRSPEFMMSVIAVGD